MDANGNGNGMTLAGPAIMAGVGKHMAPLNGHLIPPAAAPPLPQGWPVWRHRIFTGMGVGAAAVTTMAFIESFAGLVDWARHHGLHGLLALIAPVTVDTFILGGEAVALVAIMDGYPRRFRWYGYGFALAGLTVSVAGNVGRDGWHVTRETMATYAVAPLAMFGFLWLSLVLVKRHLMPAGKDKDKTPGIRPDKTPPRTRTRTPVKADTDMDKARDAILAGRDKGKTIPQFAAEIGVRPKTVQRARADIRKGQGHG